MNKSDPAYAESQLKRAVQRLELNDLGESDIEKVADHVEKALEKLNEIIE